jgi:hypothetical protein
MTPSATRRCYSCSKSRQENEPGWADYLEAVSSGLGALGWRTRTGAELEPNTVQTLLVDAHDVLLNLGIFDDRFELKANSVKAQGKPSPAQHFTHSYSQPSKSLNPRRAHVLSGRVEQLKQ